MKYELLLVNLSRDSIGDLGFRDCIGQHLIAEYLRLNHFQAKVFSGNAKQCVDVIENEIHNSNIPCLGFYVGADNITATKNIIRHLKLLYPNVKFIVGGPQTLGLTYEDFDCGIDYAIIGEGEIPMLSLLSFLIDGIGELKDIPSLIYKSENQTLKKNPTDKGIIENLDSIPYPKYENSLNKSFRKNAMVGIITGRGCPFSCAFCYEGSNTKNVRHRSIKNVMEEIDYVIANNPHLRYFNIYDDTFTLNRERLLTFCSEMKKRNLKWFCEGHGYYLSRNTDIIPVMIESGLIAIQLGIESGSSDVLKAYNKKTAPQDIIDIVKIAKSSGITTISGNFIIGGAIESQKTIDESKAFAKQLIEAGRGVIELSVVYFSPYPNTDMVTNPEKYCIHLCENMYNHTITSMKSPVITTDELSLYDIYNAKSDFEDFLYNVYHENAMQITKKELLQSLFCKGKRANFNITWKKHYDDIEYISTFIKHLSIEEQEYSEDKYPIRSFDDFAMIDGTMKTHGAEIYGKEAIFLLYSDGRHKCSELTSILGINRDKLKELYIRLNELCYVYLSDY